MDKYCTCISYNVQIYKPETCTIDSTDMTYNVILFFYQACLHYIVLNLLVILEAVMIYEIISYK